MCNNQFRFPPPKIASWVGRQFRMTISGNDLRISSGILGGSLCEFFLTKETTNETIMHTRFILPITVNGQSTAKHRRKRWRIKKKRTTSWLITSTYLLVMCTLFYHVMIDGL